MYKQWKPVQRGIWLIFVLPLLIFSAEPLKAQARFLISGDWAQFKDARGQTYFEIYYSIPKAALAYHSSATGGFRAEVLMSLRIFKEDSLWAATAWKIQDQVEDTTEVSILAQLVDQLRYAAEGPGNYSIYLYARDPNQEAAEDSIVIPAYVQEYDTNSLQTSGIQLATQIQPAQTEKPTPFTKGRYEIIPNPGQLFGEGTTDLYYYLEMYNIQRAIPSDEYRVKFTILNSNLQPVPSARIPSKLRKKRFDSAPELGKVDLSALPTGIYTLRCQVIVDQDSALATAEKKFYIYNPGVEPLAGVQTEAAPITSQFHYLDGYTAEQLDDEFDKMRYLTKQEHRAFYKSLRNVEGKRDYLYTLWKELRTDKMMRPDLYRLQYLQRVNQANQMFGRGFQEGWKTDMGRVFILYGPPSNVERHENEIDMKPYRIWQYEHLEGGVIFVFVDRQGFNRYELIHSTKRGEMYEPNWESLIRVAR